MLPKHEAMRDRHTLLVLLDVVVFELDDQAALRADEVIVVLIRNKLEARRAPLEATLFDDAALLKHPQGAVHGRRSNSRIALAHFAQQLISGDVALNVGEGVENELSSRRGLELVLGDVLAEPEPQRLKRGAVHLGLGCHRENVV